MMRRILHHAGVKPRPPLSRARKALLAIGGIALAIHLFPALHRPQLRLVWNVSPSVPLGLYRIVPPTDPLPGELVAVRPSPGLARFMAERQYVEAGALLIKPVAAVGGATVCRIGERVTINGHHVANALNHDRLIRRLPRWAGCHRLREDQLFLIAPATSGSFDSRYFGPLDRATIVGRALPVWTWS